MPRFKLLIEYDGTPYAGWQAQENAPSVQQAIEEAIYSFAQENIRIQCAGRTDAGVHATSQVAHMDLEADRTPFQIQQGINQYLLKSNHPIAILEAEQVDPEFNARFDATYRTYEYYIINRQSPLTITKNRAWHVYTPLNIAAMQQAATHLIGHHDFTSFRASECQAKSPIKTLKKLELEQVDERIIISVGAISFLHHQVRNIVGTLKLFGDGKFNPEIMKVILDAKDRSQAGPTAPACGLYLTGVHYNNKTEQEEQ